MKRAVVFNREGMGDGNPELSLSLMEKYLSSSLENDDVKEAYIFYNRGVVAALSTEKMRGLLATLVECGAGVYYCGVCLEYYDVAKFVEVGKICCMNDIRVMLNEHWTDFL